MLPINLLQTAVRLLALSFALLTVSEVALAKKSDLANKVRNTRAGIVKCQSPKAKLGRVCVIETNKGSKGSLVSIYDQEYQWVASGKILKILRNRALIFFENTNAPLLNSYIFEVGTERSYRGAFSRHADY